MRNMVRVLWAILLISLLPLCAHAEKALTLMVYMCGSDLESGHGAASSDLIEIASAGIDREQVNVLIMTGGTKNWLNGIPADALSVYTPFRGSLRMLTAFEDASMGDPASLKTFLDYGYREYPAQRYALILWDHGGGPMGGVCRDERYENDSLSMAELVLALNSSPVAEEPLEWIGFDACLMGSAELASLMTPYANYMIASEETESVDGWNYTFLQDIASDVDGAETGRRVVEAYFNGGDSASGRTLSCIDLSVMDELSEALDAFYSGLDVTEGNYALFAWDLKRTTGYGKGADNSADPDLVDLMGLTQLHASQRSEYASDVIRTLEEAVIASDSDIDGSFGLSVYHPFHNKRSYLSDWIQDYPTLGFSSGYTEYTGRFTQFLFGETTLSWQGLTAAQTEDPSVFALPLTEEQQQALAGAELNVLRYDEASGSYARLNVSNVLELEDGVLYGKVSDRQLMVSDGMGQCLCVPYSIREDGTLAVYVNYTTVEDADSEEASRIVTDADRGPFDDYSTTASVSSEQSAVVTEAEVAVVGDAYETTQTTAETSEIETAIAAYGDTHHRELTAVTPYTAEATSVVTPATVMQAFSLNTSPVCASDSGMDWLNGERVAMAQITPATVMAEASVRVDSYTVMSPEALGLGLGSLNEIGTEAYTEAQQLIDVTEVQQVEAAQVLHAVLILSVDEAGEITVSDTQVYDPAAGSWTSRNAQFSGYDVMLFPSDRRLPTESDGCLNGFELWEPCTDVAERLSVCEPVFTFEQSASDGEDWCVAFSVTDWQNNTASTGPVLIG